MQSIKTAAEQRLRSLYHYRPFNDVHLTRIFTENTLYCSDPSAFNDPWDCQPCFSKAVLDDPAGYERLVRWFVQLGRKYFPMLPEEEHQRREQMLRTDRAFLEARVDEFTASMGSAIGKQYRVVCLTPHADSPLMWAHYGRSHSGVCLEFSVANPLMCGALPVRYLDRYPVFDPTDSDIDANLLPLLAKSADWGYEREFRLIVAAPGYTFPKMPPTKDNFVELPAGALTSIIMGCQMPQTDRDLLRRLVQRARYPLSLYAAHRVSDRYALELRPAV